MDRGNIEPTLGRQHRREPHRSFSGWMGRPARKRCTSRGGGPPMTGARAMIGAEGDRGDPASATHLQEFCIASSRQIGKTRDRAPSPRARCDDAPTLHAGGRGGREARRRRRSSGRAVGAFLSSTAGSIPCDRKSLSGAATASALASKRCQAQRYQTAALPNGRHSPMREEGRSQRSGMTPVIEEKGGAGGRAGPVLMSPRRPRNQPRRLKSSRPRP